MSRSRSATTSHNSNTNINVVARKNKIPMHQLYRWCITIPMESQDLDSLWDTLTMYCKQYTFQGERGESGYEHWQIVLSLFHKEYFAVVKNIFGTKAHIEPCDDWRASKTYCSKEESRMIGCGPYTETTPRIKIIRTLRAWQTMLENIILNETNNPDDRIIHWWYDNGNQGKTAFCRYMLVNHHACVLSNGPTSDIAFALPRDPKIILFNIPRDREARTNYGVLEMIKDGLIFSGKYESRTKVFNTPVLVIFSNFLPDVTKLSTDRWSIFNIDDMKYITTDSIKHNSDLLCVEMD